MNSHDSDEYQSICKCGCRAIDHSLMHWQVYQSGGRIPVGPCGKCGNCHGFEGKLGPRLIALADCNVTGIIDDPIEPIPLLQQDGSPIPVEPGVLIMPHGMASGNTEQDLMEAGLRAIAVAASEDSIAEWAEKYGTNFENDVFAMHRYCWCEKEDCPRCSGSEPHFLFKPTGFSIDWYKFIGRSMEPSRSVSAFDIVVMILHCLVSVYYMENERVFRTWRCSKCGAEHKLAVVPLKKLIDAIWTHPKCGGHWEIVEEDDEAMVQGKLIDQEKDE